MTQTLLDQYKTFVDGVTSPASKYHTILEDRIEDLAGQGADVSRLLTAAIGLNDEAGEFAGIVKKIVFHGKEYTPENVEHLKKELGDVLWYWMQGCIALGVDPQEVILTNIKKLESRYPGGSFSVEMSENRKPGDL
jgi:NTP pyrophosphatase (non-canonical NTP hydrolase)